MARTVEAAKPIRTGSVPMSENDAGPSSASVSGGLSHHGSSPGTVGSSGSGGGAGGRYLRIFGPATAASFAGWAGVGPRTAATCFDDLASELLEVRTAVGYGWILSDDEPSFLRAPEDPAPARLLPSGDAYWLLQGADRELLIPDEERRPLLWTPRVWPGALLVDGEIVGTWRRAGVDVSIDLWWALTAARRDAVETEATALPLPGLAGRIRVRWEAGRPAHAREPVMATRPSSPRQPISCDVRRQVIVRSGHQHVARSDHLAHGAILVTRRSSRGPCTRGVAMPEISNEGVRIVYDVAGRGRPLMLLHGWSCDRSWWTEPGYVADLSRDHLLINIDLRGHGQSDKPHEPAAYVGGIITRDVLAIADRERIERFAIWGQSYGGWAAWMTAAAVPERVPAMVTSGAWDPSPGTDESWRLFDEAYGAPLRRGGTKALIDVYREEDGEAFDSEFPPWAQAVTLRADPDALIAAQARNLAKEGLSDLEHFPVPALLIAGEREDPDDDALKIAEMIPSGQRLRIPGRGHGGACQASEVAVPVVRTFLDRWFPWTGPEQGQPA